MPRILIRADATAAMGTGHVMRCLALAQALMERGHGVLVASAALPAALAARLSDAGCALAALDDAADGTALTALAAGKDIAAGVIDGYHFDAAYRAAFKAALGPRPVLAIDDGQWADAPAHADLILNPGGAVDADAYRRSNPDARLLPGPAYALLRAEFRRALATPLPPLAERRDILLTFGGTDPAGLTVPCVKRLAPALPPRCRLVVAVGGSNPRQDCIAAACARWPDRVALHVESPDMAGLMRGAGLALSAAGGTLGELACMAVPTVLVVVADNQESSARQAAADGRVVMVDARGDGAPLVGDLADATLALWADHARRQSLSQRIAGDVDAQGALRAADALAALI